MRSAPKASDTLKQPDWMSVSPGVRARLNFRKNPPIHTKPCVSLYTYRYGAIGFLELLAKFEEMLELPSPQTNPQKALDFPE